MKKSLFAFALCAAMLTAVAAEKANAAPASQAVQPISEKISVTVDKTEVKCGETITFNVKLTGKNIAKRLLLATVEGNAKIRSTKKLVTDENGCAKLELVSATPGAVYVSVRIYCHLILGQCNNTL